MMQYFIIHLEKYYILDIMKRKLDNITFLTKNDASKLFNYYTEYMDGELYFEIYEVQINLRHLLEGDSDQRLLPGEYSLYMWGPQGSSLWIRNNGDVFEFHEYDDRDIYAKPQDKYFNEFISGYIERKFDNLKIIKN